MILAARRLAFAAALVAGLVTAAPQPSHATGATLQRSLQNMLFFPFDFALSPFVATRAVVTMWQESDDSTAVKIAYPVVGVAWATGIEAGASLLRGVAGIIEFLPGLVLLPTESELHAIYELPEHQEALVDQEFSWMNVRFGVDYVSPASN